VAHAPLWLRSALRRPASALSILVLTVLTTATAASAPMLLRAVQQSALRTALDQAPPGTADVVVTGATDQAHAVSDVVMAVAGVAELAHQSGLFQPVVTTAETSDAGTVRRGGGDLSSPGLARVRVAARSDACAAFPVVAGRCPSGPKEVLVPTTLARGTLAVGQSLTLSEAGDTATLSVVGRYDAARTTALLLADTAPVIGETSAPDLVMGMASLGAHGWPLSISARASVEPHRLTLDRESAARATVVQVQQALVGEDADLSFDTALPDLLGRVDADQRAATGLIFVVAAQVVALAWFGAVVVMRMTARIRVREWALGRLRGLPRRAWLSAIYAEPAVLIVLGGAAGLALAVQVCRVAARRYLVGGVAVELWRPPVLLGAGLALLGLAAALVAASLRTARAPLATLLRESADPTRTTRPAVVLEALLYVLTVASLYQLVAGGSLVGAAAGLAFLAPGLVATSAGLLAIRVFAAAVRRRTSRPARTARGLILWRQLARVPSVLQRNVAVAIAVALAVFATQLGALSAVNRARRADGIVGAATVAKVKLPAGVDLLGAVRAADPGGASAMAVAERAAPSDGETSRVVAVDASRLAAVAAWRPIGSGFSLGQLGTRLRPKRPVPIVVRGTRLTLHLTTGNVVATGLGVPSGPPAPELAAVLDTGSAWQTVPLGLLRTGAATLGAPVPCPAGCRLVKFIVQNTRTATYAAAFTVTSLATDSQPASTFAGVLTGPTRWQPAITSLAETQGVTMAVTASAQGLQVRAQDRVGTAAPAFAPSDLPDPVPALLGNATDATAVTGHPGDFEGTGFDDQRQVLAVIGRSPILPRALDHGVLVDLAAMSAVSDPAASRAIPEVWFAPGAHPAVYAALRKAGVTVQSTETLSAALGVLAGTGTARAVLVDLALAWLAAVLVLAVHVTTYVVDGSRRRQQWRLGRLSGISRRQMAALAFTEVTTPALLGVVLGGLAGVLAIAVAGRRLPLFAADTIGPPLRTTPAWGTLAVIVLVGVAAVLVTALAAASSEASADRAGR
jgi:putative ABC transport system permease protein